jgi:hypothetical protein
LEDARERQFTQVRHKLEIDWKRSCHSNVDLADGSGEGANSLPVCEIDSSPEVIIGKMFYNAAFLII